MQVQTLCATVAHPIDELKAKYEQQINELQGQIYKLKINAIDWENKYLYTKEQLDLLLYKRYARSAERSPSDGSQLLLFTCDAEPEAEEQSDISTKASEIKVASYTRSKGGRKPIDPAIRREEKIIDIAEEEKTCACGSGLSKIGEESNEKLQIIPPRIYVEKTIRPKYACRNCEGTEDEDKPVVRIAAVEPSMIPRSISSPSLLSTIFTHKFEDHLPYYRQEKQFERIGVSISRQDMSNWQQHVYNKLTPLFALMKETVKSGPVIKMDETGMQVLSGIKTKKKDKEVQTAADSKLDIQKGWMWLALGGFADKKVAWYEYHESRAGKHAKDFLDGYSGYLQTDGYSGYDTAVKGNNQIIHVGCFAHARRKFFEASKAGKKPQSAEEGIKYIRKLYDLENKIRSENLDEEAFVKKRKTGAEAILEQFKSWLLKRAGEIPPSNLLGTALNYTLNQWDKMVMYLESYHLTPDNNACENAIRPFVIGRKNWLMSGSPVGAESSCGIYSLIETAKQNDIIPFNYLMALFEKAPLASSREDWDKLLPWNIFLD
jgi:transposase